MLKLCHNIGQLRFHELMEVYSQSNRDNARERYTHLDDSAALMQAEQDFYHYLSQVFFKTAGAVYALWEDHGTCISALRMEPYQDGFLLEALETHPAYRRKGFASSLIRAVQVQYRGKRIYSHVHKKNESSLAVHTACGFRKILDHGVYIDGSVTQNSVTLLWEE